MYMKIFSDITILLAMVVFMDQLSAQTPPMKDNVPVIGQVSSGSRFSWWNFHRESHFSFFSFLWHR